MRRHPTILRSVALLQMVFVFALSSVRICGMREHAREAQRVPEAALHDCCRSAGVSAPSPDCCMSARDGDAAVRPARASWVFVVTPAATAPRSDTLVLPAAPPIRVWTASRSSPPTPLRV